MVIDKALTDSHTLANEASLIRAAQQDASRFRPLYEQYYRPVFLFVFHKVIEKQAAADITSQVFLKAIVNLKKYEPKGFPFSSWLYRIAHNEVMQYFRTNKKERKVMLDTAMLEEIADTPHDQDVEALKKQLVQAVQQLSLPEIHLIELRFYEKKPFQEIAYILGITENNAKVRTYRLLEKIKQLMTKRTKQ